MWPRRDELNVWLLAACQALFWGALMIGITMSGLVGQMLAEHKALATLPAGILALTTIFIARPASVFMQRFGRRAGFLLGALAGLAGGIVCAGGIFAGSFLVFCLGNAVLGIYQAIGQFYRFAATDSVAPERAWQGGLHRAGRRHRRGRWPPRACRSGRRTCSRR